ncbi:hypothetical protein Zm00014a_032988 [Zea mays]|nr:hypothetical protein Zm00014a_032988 [Zea mays]
MLYYKL